MKKVANKKASAPKRTKADQVFGLKLNMFLNSLQWGRGEPKHLILKSHKHLEDKLPEPPKSWTSRGEKSKTAAQG